MNILQNQKVFTLRKNYKKMKLTYKGKSAMAMYFMGQDKNRDWRINGVQLFLSKKLKV